MGEVIVRLRLENATDRELVHRNLLTEKQVRIHQMDGVVDTGAVMLMLPQDIVEALGLRILRKAIVPYADERREERPIAGAVSLHVGSRSANVDRIVGLPASEALLGQVPLELMDLLVDCGQHKLLPRPESPLLPLLKLK